MRKFRDKAHSRFRQFRRPENWENYTELRNYVTRAIKHEQKAFMEHTVRQKNSNSTWNTLRSLQVIRSKKSNTNNSFATIDEINSYFTTISVTVTSAHHEEILRKYESGSALGHCREEFVQNP